MEDPKDIIIAGLQREVIQWRDAYVRVSGQFDQAMKMLTETQAKLDKYLDQRLAELRETNSK